MKTKKQFLRDIDYKQIGDTKSNRSKLIRRILVSIASSRRVYTSEDELCDLILVIMKKG